MISKTIQHLEEGVISLLLVGMTLLVFVEVVMRFGFNFGFLWMQELTLHMSGWMVLFGASYGVKIGSHIGVDAVVRLLRPNIRRLVAMFAVFLCMIYTSLFLYGSWIYLSKIYKYHIELEDLPIEKWVAHSILIIGFVMLGWRFLELMWKLFTHQETGFHLADEAAEVLEEMGIASEDNRGHGTVK